MNANRIRVVALAVMVFAGVAAGAWAATEKPAPAPASKPPGREPEFPAGTCSAHYIRETRSCKIVTTQCNGGRKPHTHVILSTCVCQCG